MDLFGSFRVFTLDGKHYAFFIIDDYIKFAWVLFCTHKDNTLKAFERLCKQLKNEKGCFITSIINDHKGKFENKGFKKFCNA